MKKEYISFDSHKRYTIMEREEVVSGKARQVRIQHREGAIRDALKGCRRGTAVAVEATSNWYWIVTEIEEAGLKPLLVHPRKAKLMMGMINSTDKIAAHGLNVLQRNKTLPVVWIPPAELRDLRELTRTRIFFGRHRTRLKNRIQSAFAKYGLCPEGFSDLYGGKGRKALEENLKRLPKQTRRATGMQLKQLDFVVEQIEELEKELKELVKATPEMELLMGLPGIGLILSTTVALEVGDVERFVCAEHLASYAGTTPRVHASGDKVRYGSLRPDVNRYLQWGFVEAGNSVAVNHGRRPERHVSRLYAAVRHRRGHSKAIGAVARHLAEAAYYVLHKKEPYRDPSLR